MKQATNKKTAYYIFLLVSAIVLFFIWLPLAINSILAVTRPIPLTFLQALGIALLAGANVMFGFSRAIKETDAIHKSTMNLGKTLLLSSMLIGLSMLTTSLVLTPTTTINPSSLFNVIKDVLIIVSKLSLFISIVIIVTPIMIFTIDLIFSINPNLSHNDK